MEHIIARNCTIISWMLELLQRRSENPSQLLRNLLWYPILLIVTLWTPWWSYYSPWELFQLICWTVDQMKANTVYVSWTDIHFWSLHQLLQWCVSINFALLSSLEVPNTSHQTVHTAVHLFAGGNSQDTWSSLKTESCHWEVYHLPECPTVCRFEIIQCLLVCSIYIPTSFVVYRLYHSQELHN